MPEIPPPTHSPSTGCRSARNLRRGFVALLIVSLAGSLRAQDEDDEFFFVVSGRLLIDLEDRVVTLEPGQGFVVPRGVEHRTRAPERTIILMVENAGIIPTGDPA